MTKSNDDKDIVKIGDLVKVRFFNRDPKRWYKGSVREDKKGLYIGMYVVIGYLKDAQEVVKLEEREDLGRETQK